MTLATQEGFTADINGFPAPANEEVLLFEAVGLDDLSTAEWIAISTPGLPHNTEVAREVIDIREKMYFKCIPDDDRTVALRGLAWLLSYKPDSKD